MEIVLRPIGFVKHGHPDNVVDESLHGVDGEIHVFEEYAQALRGLEGFSHIIIVAYLHRYRDKCPENPLIVRFRRFLRYGFSLDELPEVGVFACDAPCRPNPIAITIARLLGIENNVLKVRNLDLYDGTPVLDIKPYTPSRRIEDLSVPRWFAEFSAKVRERLGIEI